MTNYRIFLLSFLTVSWVFLSGLNKSVDKDMSTVEKQETAVELKSVGAKNSRKLMKTKQTSIKATNDGVADDNNPIKRNALDLSVPFKDAENADLKIQQNSSVQSGMNNIFAPETKKKPRSLELDGDLLMSPEPEAGKQKSVDGAGFVIKLKP
jgi:hypothetical protein